MLTCEQRFILVQGGVACILNIPVLSEKKMPHKRVACILIVVTLNWIIYRLSDVLLIKAALVQLETESFRQTVLLVNDTYWSNEGAGLCN